jgi:hypothetical protein
MRMPFRSLTRAGYIGVVLCLAPCCGGALAQATAECVVQRVEGQPVASARGVGRIAVEPGIVIGRGGIVRTGQEERVTLGCSEGLTVIVGPETEISVSGILDGGARPFGLRLLDGIAGFLLDDGSPGGVQVTTPSAVAAVRSTQWAMQVDRKASAVFAREGTVFAFGDGGQSVRLGPGEGVDVTPQGDVRPAVTWGAARIGRFSTLLGGDW